MKVENKENQIALEFVKTITGIASNLTTDQLLFLARKKELVYNLLNVQVELLQEIKLKLKIPALPKSDAFETFYKQAPFSLGKSNVYCLNRAKDHFRSSYDRTEEAVTSAYLLKCDLKIGEVFNHLSELIDGREYLFVCAYTPAQIHTVANKLLKIYRRNLKISNYAYNFVIVGQKNNLGIMKIWLSNGRWRYNFGFENKLDLDMREGEILMIL